MPLNITTLVNSFQLAYLTDEDCPKILALYQTNPAFFNYCPPQPSLDTVKEDMINLPFGKVREDKYFLGIYQEGNLLGVLDFILGYPDDATVFIGLLMLDRAYQGQGIGQQLITELLAGLSHTFKKVRLAYGEENKPAERFWTKMGFERISDVIDTGAYGVYLAENTLN